MNIALDLMMPDLYLERLEASTGRLGKKFDERLIIEMEIQAAGIAPNRRTSRAEQFPQWQIKRLGQQIPTGLLNSFRERQAQLTLIATPRTHDLLSDGARLARFKTRPDLASENPIDIGLGWQRMQQSLDEPKARAAGRVYQLKGRDMGVIDADLGVANDAVAGELESRQAIFLYIRPRRMHEPTI
jgi:hypothetical protein